MPHSVTSVAEREIPRTGNAPAITPSQTTETIIRIPLSDITDAKNPAVSVEITSERDLDPASPFTKIASENLSFTKTLSQPIGTLTSFPGLGTHNINENFPVSKVDIDKSNSWHNRLPAFPNPTQSTAAVPADLDDGLRARATQCNDSGASTAKDNRTLGIVDGKKQEFNSTPAPSPSLRPKITLLAKRPKRGSLKPSRYFFPLDKFTSVPPTTYSHFPRIYDAISGFSSSVYPTSYVRTRIGDDTSDGGVSDSEQEGFSISEPVSLALSPALRRIGSRQTNMTSLSHWAGTSAPLLYSSFTLSALGQSETLASQTSTTATLHDAQITKQATTESSVVVEIKHHKVDRDTTLAFHGPQQGEETTAQNLGTVSLSSATGSLGGSVTSKASAARTRASKRISSDKRDSLKNESQVPATQTQLPSTAQEKTNNGGKDYPPRRSSRLAAGPYKRYR